MKAELLLSKAFQLKPCSNWFMYTLKISRKLFSDYKKWKFSWYSSYYIVFKIFLTFLKYLHLTPVFFLFGEGWGTTDKINYGPINTLSNFSKIYQKLIFTRINSSFRKPKLLKFSQKAINMKRHNRWDYLVNINFNPKSFFK